MKTSLRIILLFLTAAAGLGLSGCATPRVAAWERGTLADYSMRPDRDPLAGAMNEHMWFSREGSTGGRGVGRSGCGCN